MEGVDDWRESCSVSAHDVEALEGRGDCGYDCIDQAAWVDEDCSSAGEASEDRYIVFLGVGYLDILFLFLAEA